MKIALTSTGSELSSDIDPRFGRAAYFLLVDPETLETTPVENIQNLNLAQGAGIQAATTLTRHNVDALLTGNCGPKAFRVLEAAGIRVFVGIRGRVMDAIDAFNRGEVVPAADANVEGHWV
jgi:predicted Fe-Mo cluster-binding NifX family protein